MSIYTTYLSIHLLMDIFNGVHIMAFIGNTVMSIRVHMSLNLTLAKSVGGKTAFSMWIK